MVFRLSVVLLGRQPLSCFFLLSFDLLIEVQQTLDSVLSRLQVAPKGRVVHPMRMLMDHLMGERDVTNSVAMHVVKPAMGIKWFHFDDQIAVLSVHIGWVERARVSLKASAGFMPSTAVKGVEIVPPVQLELVLVLVVDKHFDIIVQHVPRHVHWHKTFAPRLKSGRPEVHPDRLSLVHPSDRLDCVR